jgi:hypothetical protein
MASTSDKRETGTITIDTSAWPLVRVTFAGVASDEAFARYLDEYAAFFKRGTYVTVFDARLSLNSKAGHRRRQAEWLRQHDQAVRRLCLGTAFCVSSPLTRGAITAVFWLQPPPCPYFVTESMPEAEAWARERLAAIARGGAG